MKKKKLLKRIMALERKVSYMLAQPALYTPTSITREALRVFGDKVKIRKPNTYDGKEAT